MKRIENATDRTPTTYFKVDRKWVNNETGKQGEFTQYVWVYNYDMCPAVHRAIRELAGQSIWRNEYHFYVRHEEIPAAEVPANADWMCHYGDLMDIVNGKEEEEQYDWDDLYAA